jgi:hypothetical protein
MITQLGYKLRYEKGNFSGGDCRIRENNIVVVNKFLPIEGKIYTIASVIDKLKPPDLPESIATIIAGVIREQPPSAPVSE